MYQNEFYTQVSVDQLQHIGNDFTQNKSHFKGNLMKNIIIYAYKIDVTQENLF